MQYWQIKNLYYLKRLRRKHSTIFHIFRKNDPAFVFIDRKSYPFAIYLRGCTFLSMRIAARNPICRLNCIEFYSARNFFTHIIIRKISFYDEVFFNVISFASSSATIIHVPRSDIFSAAHFASFSLMIELTAPAFHRRTLNF